MGNGLVPAISAQGYDNCRGARDLPYLIRPTGRLSSKHATCGRSQIRAKDDASLTELILPQQRTGLTLVGAHHGEHVAEAIYRRAPYEQAALFDSDGLSAIVAARKVEGVLPNQFAKARIVGSS
jgi:hypothetical protein